MGAAYAQRIKVNQQWTSQMKAAGLEIRIWMKGEASECFVQHDAAPALPFSPGETTPQPMRGRCITPPHINKP
jgi:hypothetical protein